MLKIKKYFPFILIVIVLTSYGYVKFNPANDEGKFCYIGTEKCGKCHRTDKQGKQLSIWMNSKHANSYKTLLSAKAEKIVKMKGYKTKAVETKTCLKCHASGYNLNSEMKSANFKVEDGVQCETCHGAGSGYMPMKIMRSHEQSVAKGLIDIKNKEKLCKECHNAESPTYKQFNFAKEWEKIEHNIPKTY